jgi:MIP family channel proteins
LSERSLATALVAEATGTFVLVLVGCGAIAVGTVSVAGVAAAFGLTVMVMVYALGHVSGAHLNPAVTVALAAGRHFPGRRVVPYWTAQVAGATAAAIVVQAIVGDVASAVTRPSGSVPQALAWEVLLTLVLMLVIVAVATDPRTPRSASGLAIGAAVALGAIVGGPVSGGSMNPARSVGPALVGGDLGALWVYLIAPPVGAVAAVALYRYLAAAGVRHSLRTYRRTIKLLWGAD